jgi:hypothetical protein
MGCGRYAYFLFSMALTGMLTSLAGLNVGWALVVGCVLGVAFVASMVLDDCRIPRRPPPEPPSVGTFPDYDR